jgi:hypothetical protein
MRRIDSHIHAFPERLALAVRERLNERGQLNAGPLLGDVAQAVRDGGFDGAWVLPYAHRAGVAASINEWASREIPRYPWLVPGATFHPDDPNLPDLVTAAFGPQGLRVVKLHCSVGAFSPADSRLNPLWLAASEARIPVVVHAGQVGGGETLDSEVRELEPVLAAHPRLRLVLAHAGHPATSVALDLMARFDNLYADLTPVWTDRVAITVDDLRRFPGRFLFGSDAPNNPTAAEEQAAEWARSGLSEDELGLILGGTADLLAG